MPRRRIHRDIFFASFGSLGPFECFFCRVRNVTVAQVVVHHIDQRRENNHPFNLAPCHQACHNRWHNLWRRGVPRPPHIAAILRTVNVGRVLTDEHKAAIAAAQVGRAHSDETKVRMSAARRAYWTPERRSALVKGAGVGNGVRARGGQVASAKLTEGQVREVRALCDAGWQRCDIAAAYGVTDVLVGKIARRDIWKHLPELEAATP